LTPSAAVRSGLSRIARQTVPNGVNVTRHQWVTFVVSAFFTGVAGAFVAPLYNVVAPDMAHWSTSAVPVIAAVIGGASYFLGPAAGAFVFLYLRWAISRSPTLEAHWELVFGTVIILVLLYFKEGVARGLLLLGEWLDRVAHRYRHEGAGAAAAFARRSARRKAADVRASLSGGPDRGAAGDVDGAGSGGDGS